MVSVWASIFILLVWKTEICCEHKVIKYRNIEEEEKNITKSEEEEQEHNVYRHDKGWAVCLFGALILIVTTVALRFAIHREKKYRHLGTVVNIDESVPFKDSHLYLLYIDTGKWHKAGTNAHVRLEIHARNFCSQLYCLKPTDRIPSILSKGHRDIFMLRTTRCLGEIFSITLIMITRAQMHVDSWYLERILLFDVTHNKKWQFPCFRWLSTHKEPSLIVKLFPVSYSHLRLSSIIQSNWDEMHLWVSVFISFNRQGRLSRAERLVLCANKLMLVLMIHTIAMNNNEYRMMFIESNAIYLLIWLGIIVGSTFINMFFEFLFRNSQTWVFEEDKFKIIHQQQCDCRQYEGGRDRAIPVPPQETFRKSYEKTCPSQCKSPKGQDESLTITNQKGVGHPLQSIFIEGKENIRKITKYYDMADKLLLFFTAWNTFVHKYLQILNELKKFLSSNDEETLYGKHSVLSWIEGTMEEVRVKMDIRSRKLKDITEANEEDDLPPSDSTLFPSLGNTDALVVGNKNRSVCRLVRTTTVLALICVCENLNGCKYLCASTVGQADRVFLSALHYVISSCLLAMYSLVLGHFRLCTVTNGTVTKYVETMSQFLTTYATGAESSTTFDVIYPPVEQCEKVTDDSRKQNQIQLFEFKKSVEAQTTTIIRDIVKSAVMIMNSRHPLGIFYDYMQYKADHKNPQEWASTCIEFLLPIGRSIVHHLIYHIHHHLNLRCHCCVRQSIKRYLETVIINSSMMASREILDLTNRKEDQTFEPQVYCFHGTDRNIGSDYVVLVQRFKDCIIKLFNPSPDSAFCTEGKTHIRDNEVLLLMLEENKLTTSQLACPQMISQLALLVENQDEKLKSLKDFISHILNILTDSQDLIRDKDNEISVLKDFLKIFRHRLLDLGFLLVKLIQRCEIVTANNVWIPKTPGYWTKPNYQNLKFIQNISKLKQELLDPGTPESESLNHYVQDLAFEVDTRMFPGYVAFGAAIFLVIQNFICLGIISVFALSGNSDDMFFWGPFLVLLAIVVDVSIIQPVKIVTLCAIRLISFRRKRGRKTSDLIQTLNQPIE